MLVEKDRLTDTTVKPIYTCTHVRAHAHTHTHTVYLKLYIRGASVAERLECCPFAAQLRGAVGPV